jgi:hypothetical protein
MKSAKELHKTLLEIATLARLGDENARSHILHLATKATGIKQARIVAAFQLDPARTAIAVEAEDSAHD